MKRIFHEVVIGSLSPASLFTRLEQKQRKAIYKTSLLTALMASFLLSNAHADGPGWTFEPLTATTVAVPPGTTESVQYTVTNRSSQAKNLVLYPTSGISQGGPCNLAPKGKPGSSCKLTININGDQLPSGGIQNGPKICQTDQNGNVNPNQCYQPFRAKVLHIINLPSVAIGQPFQGGTVACLNGGNNNLIAAVSDNSNGMAWSELDKQTDATSKTDGALNTAKIVSKLGNARYAAQLCNDYEIDSQGNTPCQAGNTCYDDWFLPAKDQLNCLYTNRAAIDHFENAVYWSSTEFNSHVAWDHFFSTGFPNFDFKFNKLHIRCVRAFTP